jgi:hypothetical protein
MFHVVGAMVRVDSHDSGGAGIAGIGSFEPNGDLNEFHELPLEFRRPCGRELGPDRVDQIAPEGEVQTFVPHDVLELLPDADHLLLTFERKHHGETCVEEDPFHDDVVPDQIVEEALDTGEALRSECRIKDAFSELDYERVLVPY